MAGLQTTQTGLSAKKALLVTYPAIRLIMV